jgi:hypothetical protein
VPDEWRAPYADFLKRLGITETSAVLEESRFDTIGSTNAFPGPEFTNTSKNFGVFRIEYRDVCADPEDMCPTIIAHIVSEKFVVDAMFVAGPKITMRDVGVPVFGTISFPYVFWGRRGKVVLVLTHEGWLIAPLVKPDHQ